MSSCSSVPFWASGCVEPSDEQELVPTVSADAMNHRFPLCVHCPFVELGKAYAAKHHIKVKWQTRKF
ncbi:MAG TPA: hypothetical protein VE641_14945 [Chthoniobacterales bacterium]|nr:hypothetical protein [Chthoniobacterales bacterium]